MIQFFVNFIRYNHILHLQEFLSDFFVLLTALFSVPFLLKHPVFSSIILLIIRLLILLIKRKLIESTIRSGFVELGWNWKTRVFKKSNWLRFKYGYFFQINGFKPKDNKFFVQNGNETALEEFQYDLTKSKLTITNLVFPVHFEFGPSRRIYRDTYFRYSTRNKLKIGVGGYAGFNIGTRQKLKYTADGEKIKDKIKRNYNTSDFVYGLSSYIAFGDTALYVKYDLSPIFKNQVIDQNNISVGVRFDMD